MDSICSLLIAVITMMYLYPLGICSAKILLQTIPPDIVTQLDKCVHEALTLDGVLEFRHERFWVVGSSISKRDILNSVHPHNIILAGHLHVRIRRESNEQLVLFQVKEKLLPLVPLLTVQVFKDDWTRGSTTLQLLKNSTSTLSSPDSRHADYANITYSPIVPSSPTSHQTLNYQNSTFNENNYQLLVKDSQHIEYSNSQNMYHCKESNKSSYGRNYNQAIIPDFSQSSAVSPFVNFVPQKPKPSPYYVNIDFLNNPNNSESIKGLVGLNYDHRTVSSIYK